MENLKIDFKSEYFKAIREKMIDAIKENRKFVYINGELETFAVEELESNGIKVEYYPMSTVSPWDTSSHTIIRLSSHTIISWIYDSMRRREVMIVDSKKFLMSLGYSAGYINHKSYTPAGELLSLKDILDRFYNINVASIKNSAINDVDEVPRNTVLCDSCGMRNDKKELICINCGQTI